jgi:2-polyprenyl-6-methoxyphenol hydroxylase-like FAD-dependent oxidoreductase
LVDRDEIPDGPASRSGVPQGKHFHALLPGGMDVACDLFHGFEREMVDAGSVIAQPGDFYFYRPEGKSYSIMDYRPEPPKAGASLYCQTRGLLEHIVRKRVEAIPNVEVRYETAVRDPVIVGSRVAGVSTEGEDLEADLVVDAAGRASRCDRWLPQLGFDPPEESVVNVDFAYTSVLFAPDNADAFEGVGFFVLPPLEGPYVQRAAALVRMERGTWMVSLGGRFGDYPPQDIEGFVDYTKTLAYPFVYELLQDARPVTEPVRYRYPKAVRRHFERLEIFPEGLVPIGDAICHFNPIYGQGMSSAMRQVVALEGLLRRHSEQGRGLDGLALEFFPEANEVIRGPWAIAAAADFQNPLTTGDFPLEEAHALEMLLLLSERARTDEVAEQLVTDVFLIRKPLSALLEPPWPQTVGASFASA